MSIATVEIRDVHRGPRRAPWSRSWFVEAAVRFPGRPTVIDVYVCDAFTRSRARRLAERRASRPRQGARIPA